jgi:indoleamine 2,3-dioxygenase
MKIPHRQSLLTDHLTDMRRFMPREHRALITEVQAMPDVRPLADKQLYNDVLEAMATFREVHIGWAMEYIHKRVADPRGTGGTPFMQWLAQLIDETRAHKIA